MSRRSARISAVREAEEQERTTRKPRRNTRKNPPREAAVTSRKRTMPQINDEPPRKQRKINDSTSQLAEVVKEEIHQEEQKLQNNGSIEFLPPFPKQTQSLPLKDPNQKYEEIKKAQNLLSHCDKALKWCRFEYFYSLGDEIYFRHNEFQSLLVQLGYGNVEKLPIREWRKIRRKMGPPKRLSKIFLKKEREKLDIWRKNSLNVRSGAVPCPQFAQLLPPLPQQKMFVLGIHPKTNVISEGILQMCANGLFGVFFAQKKQSDILKKQATPAIDAWLQEDAVMTIYSITKTTKESPEKGLLTTLAIAAEVSPRHNGDVRTLKSVIKLLKRKEIVVSKITEFHDKAEIMVREDKSFPDSFQKEYAQLLVKLSEIKKELKPKLIQLRASQEKSPFRSLPKRL